jgi:hypothetical protein
MGQPFHGIGFTGYDNLKKKYVMSWMDNAATGIMYSEGTYDPATKTFTYVGECPDVMNGKYARSRTVDKMIDDKHRASNQALKESNFFFLPDAGRLSLH